MVDVLNRISTPDKLNDPTETGETMTGVAPNELTALEDRDPYVGTPWHKHVAANVERVEARPLPAARR